MTHIVVNNPLLIQLKHLIISVSKHTSKLYIAFSGGMDSHILLHTVKSLFAHMPLQAIHVNHGLHPKASQWAIHCQAVCDALHIPLKIENVTSQLNDKAYQDKSKGPEEAARNARYAILKKKLKPNDCLLTGHHMDDQAETLLLQLARGCGIQGLASMPIVRHYPAGYYHLRPFLNWTYRDRITYAKQHQLKWIEDSSNFDEHFTRNFIRHSILPNFKKRWPNITTIISRTARNCAEATHLCAEIAQEDLAIISHSQQNSLSIAGLLKLGDTRSRNALRYWLKEQLSYFPSSVHLDQVEKLLYSKATCPQVILKNQVFKRYRHYLYSFPQQTNHSISSVPIEWNINKPLRLHSGHTLIAKRTRGLGIRQSILSNHSILEVCFRKGGERFQPSGKSTSHSLKKLYQEWNILPWQRSEVPLLYFQNQLIAVIGYAISEESKAHVDEPSILVQLINNS